MRELVQAYDQRMREVAQRERALFVDLPALLRTERGLFYDGLHFNEHGARVTARVLAEHLWNSGIG
jgi:lysophospholipase L1-like esterase